MDYFLLNVRFGVESETLRLYMTYTEYVQWMASRVYIQDLYYSQSYKWSLALHMQMLVNHLESDWLEALTGETSRQFLAQPAEECEVRAKMIIYLLSVAFVRASSVTRRINPGK